MLVTFVSALKSLVRENKGYDAGTLVWQQRKGNKVFEFEQISN